AGARNDAVGGGLAGGHGGTEGQIGRALLVARVDRADAVGAVVKGIEERIVLHPGKTEEGVDAVGEQALDDDLGGRAALGGLGWRHARSSLVCARFGWRSYQSLARPTQRQPCMAARRAEC